jgi:cytochrome P450
MTLDQTESTERVPVTDFASDFDHTDPQWVNDPYPIWDDLRGRCPVAHTDRYGGAWLPVRHEDVAAVAYDTDHFTSRVVVMSNIRPTENDLPAPIGIAPPITSDPPFHALARRLLLPAFGPKKIAEYEGFTRELCRELLDAMDGCDTVDAAVDYAQHIPLRVIVKMLGFPQDDADIFRRFIHMILEQVDVTPEERQAMIEGGEVDDYINARIDEHVAHPRDDLTTFLLEAELDGQKLQPDHVRGTMVLLMVAGIDTTWSAIGASLWHLAQHADDRRRLAADPSLMATAVEEFLRAYAPVTMARLVAEDFDFNGCPFKEGDWLLLPFPAANRDPEMFEQADEVVLDRAVNRHAAFGLGIHRCIGSNLARMELRVALEEWMARYPEFELADPGGVTWSAGQVRGPRTIPVRLAP